jgi:ADP-ribosylglycohydrolase
MDFDLFTSGSRFTDDTVLTVAAAFSILENRSYGDCFRTFARLYPDAGYGGGFLKWLLDPCARPYNSWGNGAAMRVSPVGFAFDSIEKVLLEAKKSAEVTHDHPEGIKGAKACALAVYLARTGADKHEIRKEISGRFGYDLNRTIDQIRPAYSFDISCQGTVPEAIIAFLDSTGYEDAVRRAISLGGDSDTLACITGGIAQAFYGPVPQDIARQARQTLPEDLLAVIDRFEAACGNISAVLS